MVTMVDLIIKKVLKNLKGKTQFSKSLINKIIEEVLEANKELTLDQETQKQLYPNVCQALMNREDQNEMF